MDKASSSGLLAHQTMRPTCTYSIAVSSVLVVKNRSRAVVEFGVGRGEDIVIHQVTNILVWNALHFKRAVQLHVVNVTVVQPLLAREDSFFNVTLLEVVLQL